jgi:hypothetical protein
MSYFLHANVLFLHANVLFLHANVLFLHANVLSLHANALRHVVAAVALWLGLGSVNNPGNVFF